MRRNSAVVVGLVMMAVTFVPGGPAAALSPAAATFHGLNPARVLDTRPGATTIDGVSEGQGAVGAHSTTTVTIAGRGGVPAGTTAGAVALNVTAVAPTAYSFLTVWPAGATQPTASNLNLQPGVTTPNMVIVPLSTDGKISIYNDTGTTNLLVDVLGWFPTGNAFTGLNPARLLDTRNGGTTVDGLQQGDGAVGPQSITNVTIAGRGGVPFNAGSVALNITAVAPTAYSFLTVWPARSQQPTASNLNLQPGVTTPNVVIVPLSYDGRISIYNDTGTTHLLVDVLGWFPAGNAFTGLNPARVLDTRPGATTIDHVSEGQGAVGAHSTTTVTIAGRGGVPAGNTAGAVALNVTAVAPTAYSFLTVWPAGATQPTASNLNLQPGVTTPNMVIVPLSTDGKISIYNDTGTTNLLVDVLGWFPASTIAASTVRASVSTGGTQANLSSLDPAISANGQVVAFVSLASNLVTNDTDAWQDVFVRDLVSGTTEMVSVASGGTPSTDGAASSPAISADGRYVAFESAANDLVPGDTNGHTDVFVHDRITHVTTRVSVPFIGSQATGESTKPAISGDGRYVTFLSGAPDMVAGDTNGVPDVFLYDRQGVLASRVSVTTGGAQATGESFTPAISGDGRYVSYTSLADDLVAGDTNGQEDIFLYARLTGTTTRVSLTSSGSQSVTGSSGEGVLSDDGRYLAFTSNATDLVPGDTNGFGDVFVRDLLTGSITLSSVTFTGAQAAGNSWAPTISADGLSVSFETAADNMVAGEQNGFSDVFVRDLATGTTGLVSLLSNGAPTELCDSSGPSISADGRHVAFVSGCELVADDTNQKPDVYVRDQGVS